MASDDLEERVAELESVVNQELGYNPGVSEIKPQTVDCECGTTFDVNVINGLICPDCGSSANERGAPDAE